MIESNSSNNCAYRYSAEMISTLQHSFYPLQLINAEKMMKNKVKKKYSVILKVQAILILNYKERNNRKIFQSSAKLIVSVLDIDEAFKSMHQSTMTKMRNSVRKDWIVLDVVIRYSIKIFECQYKENIQHEKMDIISNSYRLNLCLQRM